MTDTTWRKESSRKGLIGRFVPTMRAADLRTVDWALLKAHGIKLIAVDLDNTLAVHGSDRPDAYAKEAVALMREAGLTVMLYSNAAYDRDKRFASGLGIEAVEGVKKPNTDALETLLERRKLTPRDVLVVGDQLITDVWSANRLGAPSLWVALRDPKELFTIRLKRIAEKVMGALWKKTYHSVPEAPLVGRLQTSD